MNQVSEMYNLFFRVYQEKKEWFVDFNGETIPFENNMVLYTSRYYQIKERNNVT